MRQPLDPKEERRLKIKLLREAADYLEESNSEWWHPTVEGMIDLLKEMERERRKRPPAA